MNAIASAYERKLETDRIKKILVEFGLEFRKVGMWMSGLQLRISPNTFLTTIEAYDMQFDSATNSFVHEVVISRTFKNKQFSKEDAASFFYETYEYQLGNYKR